MSKMIKNPSLDIIIATERLLQVIAQRKDLKPECCYVTVSHLFQYVIGLFQENNYRNSEFVDGTRKLFRKYMCLILTCRAIPSANAVSADASAAMNSHILFRVPTKQCPGICTGRCTPHSTFLIERTKKHIILPFPPAFICFRKTWIPHFRRCSRMRMQCFTRRNRNEIRMLRKFYQNRN